jgi:ribose transport system substrate-binding protein
VSDPSALADALDGATVYYVPLTAQVRGFSLTGDALEDALGTQHAHLATCDGKADPSTIAACVNQAVGARAAAIVLDSIPYAMAANALDAARAKGVHVVVTNQVVDDRHPADGTLGYVPGPGTQMLLEAADWIAADSGGKATVVLQKSTDNASTVAYADAAATELATRCPGCKVVTAQISASNFSLVAPATSAAIVQAGDAGYVLCAFDNFLQATTTAVQQSGRAGSIKVVSTAAQLSSLKTIGSSGVPAADVGENFAYQGWADADAAFRLLVGDPVPSYDVPTRLFTAANVGELDLTESAEASGTWYGPTDFAQRFTALWAAS